MHDVRLNSASSKGVSNDLGRLSKGLQSRQKDAVTVHGQKNAGLLSRAML